MGCLVEATHRLMGRRVAIKLARADRPATSRRLLREAQIIQMLTTKHVVRVFDLGLHGDVPYMVMELLDGRDLGATLEHQGPLPVALAIDRALEAAVALGEAHALGVVHSDVKPSNLFVARTRDGEHVKVIDFGIARRRGAGERRPKRNSGVRARGEDRRGTAGAVLGTPAFMSPEQILRSSSVDERSDVWSLAVTLYHLVTGELPFTGTDRAEQTTAILSQEPRRMGREIGAPWLDTVLGQALAKHRDERTASMVELAADLRPHATERGALAYQRLLRTADTGPPVTSRPRVQQTSPSLPTTVDRAPSSGRVV
jgi:serine/threonine-protein kinase